MGPVLHSSSPLVKFPGVVDHLTESHSKRLCKPGPRPLPQRVSWAGPGSDLRRLLRALKNPSRVMGIPLRAKYLSVELPAVLFCQTPRHGPLVQGSPNFPAPDSPDTCARSIPSFSLALCISNTEDLPNALTPTTVLHTLISLLGSPLVWQCGCKAPQKVCCPHHQW